MHGKELVIEQLYACLVDADSSLNVAAQMCQSSELEELEDMVRPLFKLRGEIVTEYLRVLFKRYPNLEERTEKMYFMSHSARQDDICHPIAASKISNLSSSQISEIDAQLKKIVDSKWRKTSYIVGTAMAELGAGFVGIPDVFYSSRLAQFYDQEIIEVNGDLRRMRLSEIRKVQPVLSRPET